MPYGMLDHLHAFLRDPLLATSESLGLPADHLLMALLALAAVPIGLIHSFIPIRFATFRHIYASVTGTLWAWLLLGPEFLHVLACAFGALAILRISNPNSAPIWVTAFTIGYMTIVHLRRIWFDYLGWRLDSTTAMMITVVKLNMFAWAYCDGKLVQMGKVRM
jgi:lysophospholipid acyltransferase